jgi:acetyl esterase/lipase
MRFVHAFLATSFALAVAACTSVAPVTAATPATWDDVVALPAPSRATRIAYGAAPKQFGDLRVPAGPGPHPVAILLHGGCWQAEYDLEYLGHLADRLAASGIATWSLEYRGIGDDGGGWPGTFDDVAAGVAHLRTLAPAHGLDLDRVVVAGHSAGGHLALWLAANRGQPISSGASDAPAIPIRGVVGIAGITDLREYAAGAGSCNQSVVPLLGGTAAQVPARYAAASPPEMQALGVPTRLLIGALDPIVSPAANTRFAEQARVRGDRVDVVVIDGAGHFDPVLPDGPAAMQVQQAIRDLLR